MLDFGKENVLKYAVESFAETISLKIKQLRRFIPKEKARTNTDLTGAYIEELVRGFIRSWIGHRQLLHGTFYHEHHINSGEKPLQVDGIVYDPTKGPVTLREGDFVIVHPAFCAGVVEVKMTTPSTDALETRLLEIYGCHMSHLTTTHVMGVVIADDDPNKASKCMLREDLTLDYHDYVTCGLCPIFVLFTETDDCDYEPFFPAIESMIRAMHSNFYSSRNYLV